MPTLSWSPPSSVEAEIGRTPGREPILFLRTRDWPSPTGQKSVLPILALYAVSTRYLLDISPILTVLACVGARTVYLTSGRTRMARLLIGALIIVTAAASASLSILLAFTGSW